MVPMYLQVLQYGPYVWLPKVEPGWVGRVVGGAGGVVGSPPLRLNTVQSMELTLHLHLKGTKVNYTWYTAKSM